MRELGLRPWKATWALLLGATLACRAAPEAASVQAPGAPLTGTWEVERVEQDGATWLASDAGLEEPATVEFVPGGAEDEARIAGHGGCNRYAGSFRVGAREGREGQEQAGGTLEVSPLAATRRAGPPKAMELEFHLLAALQGVERWEGTGDRLVLRGKGGVVHLHRVR